MSYSPNSEHPGWMLPRKEMITRVALYCRTAHEGEYALRSQQIRLQQYADDHGCDVEAVVCDIASGLSANRVGLQHIYELANKGMIDAVVAVNCSRFFRNPMMLIALQNDLRKYHVALVTINGDLITQDAVIPMIIKLCEEMHK